MQSVEHAQGCDARKPWDSEGLLFFKPKLITQLEQGVEPWKEVCKVLPGACTVQEYGFAKKASVLKQHISEGSAPEE